MSRPTRLTRHDGGRHLTRSNGRNCVDVDVVLGSLSSERLAEGCHCHLCSRVVCLAKVAVQTGCGGRVDDAAELLLPEDGPARLCARVRALDVDLPSRTSLR